MEAIAQTDYRCGVGVVLLPCDGAVWGPGSWAGVLWSPANGIITRLVSPGHCATLPGGREPSGNMWLKTNFLSQKLVLIMGPHLHETKQDVSGCLEHMESASWKRMMSNVHPQDMVTSRQTDSTQDMANWRGML